MIPIIYRLPNNIRSTYNIDLNNYYPNKSYNTNYLDYEYIDMNDDKTSYALVSYNIDNNDNIYEYADIYGYGNIDSYNTITWIYSSIHQSSEEYEELYFSPLMPVDQFEISMNVAWGDYGYIRTISSSNIYPKYDTSKLITLNIIGAPSNMNSASNSFDWLPYLKNLTLNDNLDCVLYGFNECISLTNVQIGNSIISVASPFRYCTSLTSIDIPDSVTSIGNYAFNGCRKLVSVNISDTHSLYVNIDGCIYDTDVTKLILCPGGIESITIPDTVTNVSSYLYYYSSSLSMINISDNNTSYASVDGVLYNKSLTTLIACPPSIAEISIPSTLTSITKYAFKKCSKLTTVDLSETSMTTLAAYAFDDAYSITEIILPPNLKTINSWAFSETGISSIDIPSTVTSIGYSAFYGCDSLTTIDLSNTSITTIDSQLFHRCLSLTSIILPDSVTSIGSSTFYNCSSLTSINIPDSVTSIGGNAFAYCTSLTSINIPSGVSTLNSNTFRYDTQSTLTITIDKEEDSISGSPWGATNATIIWNG